MKKYNILGLIMLTLIGSACKKSAANFTLNQYEYAAGDQLDFTNWSRAKQWKVYNEAGEVSDTLDGKNPQYIINLKDADGIYAISLHDNTREFENGVGVKKTFLVKTERIVLYLECEDEYKDSKIFIDGINFGHTNSAGYLKISVPVGKRLFRISSDAGDEKTETILVSVSESNQLKF